MVGTKTLHHDDGDGLVDVLWDNHDQFERLGGRRRAVKYGRGDEGVFLNARFVAVSTFGDDCSIDYLRG